MTFSVTDQGGLVSVGGHVWQMRDALRMWNGEGMGGSMWLRRDRVEAIKKSASDFTESLRAFDVPEEDSPARERYDNLTRIARAASMGAYAMGQGCNVNADLLVKGLGEFKSAVGEFDDLLLGWRTQLDEMPDAPAPRAMAEQDFEPYGFGE